MRILHGFVTHGIPISASSLMSVEQSENQPHDIDLPEVAEINNAKISGKCGILSGETVSPVEIPRNARYGTPLHDKQTAAREHSQTASPSRQ